MGTKSFRASFLVIFHRAWARAQTLCAGAPECTEEAQRDRACTKHRARGGKHGCATGASGSLYGRASDARGQALGKTSKNESEARRHFPTPPATRAGQPSISNPLGRKSSGRRRRKAGPAICQRRRLTSAPCDTRGTKAARHQLGGRAARSPLEPPPPDAALCRARLPCLHCPSCSRTSAEDTVGAKLSPEPLFSSTSPTYRNEAPT